MKGKGNSSANPRWPELLDQHYDVLIMANGTPPPRAMFEPFRQRCGRLMALDGGTRVLRRWGVPPSHVVGDLDSITKPALEWAKRKKAVVHALASQETSDMQKGLALCVGIGFRSALIAAADSNALDHVLNSLAAAATSKLRISVITPSVVVHVMRGKTSQVRRIPSRHSFSWLGWPSANACTLKGAVWTFENQKIEIGGFNSTSNRSEGKIVSFAQESGVSLLIIHLRPKSARSLAVVMKPSHD